MERAVARQSQTRRRRDRLGAQREIHDGREGHREADGRDELDEGGLAAYEAEDDGVQDRAHEWRDDQERHQPCRDGRQPVLRVEEEIEAGDDVRHRPECEVQHARRRVRDNQSCCGDRVDRPESQPD